MFGDIFQNEEQEEIKQQQFVKAVNMSSYLPLPPLKRDKTNFVGITNQGSTCYLNSLFQALFMTVPFRNFILDLELQSEDHETKLVEKNQYDFLMTIQQLFAEMQEKECRVVSTESITKMFGWENNQEYVQQDVMEAMKEILEVINRSLGGTLFNDHIDTFFKGTYKNQITCLKCGTIKVRKENFQDIMIQVQGMKSLEESLQQNLLEEELTKDNQYFCETCQCKVDAKKQQLIEQFPPILIFSLNRFTIDMKTYQRVKINNRFRFELEFDCSNYETPSESCQNPDSNSHYELSGILLHRGDAYSGHYHTYLRDTVNEGQWELFDEYETLETVYESDEDEERIKKENQGKKEGKSGGQREGYKRQAKRTIRVKKNLQKDSYNTFTNQELVKNWFDFNDTKVKAITGEELQKAFGSNSNTESAYALIYQKKQQFQRKELKGYLKNYVDKQNNEFQKEREYFESAKNIIEIQIFELDYDEIQNLQFEAQLEPVSQNQKVLLKKDTKLQNQLPEILSKYEYLVEFELMNDLIFFKRGIKISENDSTVHDLQISHLCLYICTNYLSPYICHPPLILHFHLNTNTYRLYTYSHLPFCSLLSQLQTQYNIDTDAFDYFLIDNEQVRKIGDQGSLVGEMGVKSGGNVLVEEKEKMGEQVVCLHVYKDENDSYDQICMRVVYLGVKLGHKLKDFLDQLKLFYKVDSATEYRLRFFNKNDVFYENQYDTTIKDLDIQENYKFVFEQGKILKNGNIGIRIQIDSQYLQGIKNIELTYSPDTQICQIVDDICQQYNLDPSKHRLYQTDWLEELSCQLNKLKTTLKFNQIKHNDLLLLKDDQKVLDLDYLNFDVFSNQSGLPFELQFLETIKIRKDQNLTDFKQKIITLPKMSKYIETPLQNIKLRVMNKNLTLSNILRDQQDKISKLQIEKKQLAVQILENPVNLDPHLISIFVRKRNVQNKSFGVMQEINCQFDNFLTIDNFYNELKKKLQLKDINLRKKPFLIKEGDIFSYRLESENLDKQDDFVNIDEVIMQTHYKEKYQKPDKQKKENYTPFKINTQF